MDDSRTGDKLSPFSALKKVCLISFGIFATAALVLSNTQVLFTIGCGPIGATGLTVLHNVVTFIFFSVTSKSNQQHTPSSITWQLICVGASSAVSLLSSNFLLKHSSISFHQIARIFSVPIGAAVDFFTERKKKGLLETVLLILICLAAFLATSGERRATLFNCMLASLFVLSYVATSAGIRYVSRSGGLSSSDVLRKVLPYSIGVSLFSFAAASVSMTLTQAQTTCSLSSLATLAVLALNCTIAVTVQYLSTWTMKNTSVQLYATLGQVKTAVTVLGGSVLFKQEITPVTRLAFVVIIFFGLVLILLENTDDTRLELKVSSAPLRDLFARHSVWKISVSLVVPLFALLLVFPFSNTFTRQLLSDYTASSTLSANGTVDLSMQESNLTMPENNALE